MLEKTLMLIKPSGFEKRDSILQVASHLGEIVYNKFHASVSSEQMGRHYAEHKGTELYGWLISYFENKPIEVFVYHGNNAINSMAELVGHSDPMQAKDGTIRVMANDSLIQANIEKRPIRNLVHCPKDLESAKREISIWAPNLVV